MEFKDTIEKRYSVRGYLDKEIEEDKLEYVLECARRAPSACNRQPWHFFLVKSPEGRKALFESYPRDWFATAPLHIIVAVDRSQAWVRPEDSHNHSDIDAAIAAEHICLAAESAGLGTCWVCNFDPEKMKALLGDTP